MKVSLIACLVLISVLAASPAAAQSRDAIYIRHDLISDLPGADRLDPNLKNPWGIAFSATGPFWIADNHAGVSTVYAAQGKATPVVNPLVVKVPPPFLGNSPGASTGIVYNGTNEFRLAPDMPARFIFSSEDGTISAWNPTVNA